TPVVERCATQLSRRSQRENARRTTSGVMSRREIAYRNLEVSMPHDPGLTAFTAAPPPATSVDYVAARAPARRRAKKAHWRFDAPAIAEARSAVADYLRDLGLRDPDRIAAESQ